MLGDKNWDGREGDSYKTAYSALSDLVTVHNDKKPCQFPILTGWKIFIFSELKLVASMSVSSAALCH